VTLAFDPWQAAVIYAPTADAINQREYLYIDKLMLLLLYAVVSNIFPCCNKIVKLLLAFLSSNAVDHFFVCYNQIQWLKW